MKLNLRSTWADRHGAHSTPIDKDAIDVICIYCPVADDYHIRPTEHGVLVNLRITPTKNGQQKRILAAASIRDLPAKHLPPIDDEARTSA